MASPEAVEDRDDGAGLRDGTGAAAACLLAAEQERAQGATDVAIALYDAVRSADVPEPYRLGATRGAIVTRDSVPFLMEQLGSDDAAIRDVALLTIREMPSDALADALHAHLASAPPDLRVQLITALRRLPQRRLLRSGPLAARQRHAGDPRAALGVVSAVGSGPELATTLLDVVQADRSPRREADGHRAALAHGGRDGRRPRDPGSSPEPQSRWTSGSDVIRVLGNRRSTSAVDDLLEQAGDDDRGVRVAALRAMRRVVGPNEVPALIALIQAETDDAVRTGRRHPADQRLR